jgi:ABC-type glycerol-3-phosphate transport system substrate-binding protein
MKRSFVFVTALLVVSMLLAACAPAVAPAPPATSAPAAQPTSAPASFVRLSFLIQGDDRNELNLYQQLVKEFEASHPNISVTIDWLPWDA